MTAAWKLRTEARLLDPEMPAVLTTAMLMATVQSGEANPPSAATFQRWLREMAASTKLREVIKGVYLNRMGHSDVAPAAAAHWIRARSVVSLAWVLEQAGVTNNIGDTVTCVIPTDPSWTNPQIGDRQTAMGKFRFFAMPARLVLFDEVSNVLADVRDLRFDYPRATPEKALLDWIYLGASARSRMTRPPMDLDTGLLNRRRLERLAKRMDIEAKLAEWMTMHAAYQAHPEVLENQSSKFNF